MQAEVGGANCAVLWRERSQQNGRSDSGFPALLNGDEILLLTPHKKDRSSQSGASDPLEMGDSRKEILDSVLVNQALRLEHGPGRDTCRRRLTGSLENAHAERA